MPHKSLYRVFRPRKFSEVSGQDQVTRVLEKQIERNSPGHAYLFCGSRGTGKTTTARILANALNCLSPKNGNPCGECAVCRSFAADTFVDVIEIDAASNNGVDNIRDIREKAALLPVEGRYKVYIIDEVHMLSPGAFNALLKTLEEPPEHAVFILATTEFRKIPRTIVSRCQHYNFKRISEEDIAARLRYVADEIGAKCEEGSLEMLAAQSDGALRDALSMLDQCLAGRAELTREDVQKTLGLSDHELLSALCDCLQAEDPEGAMRLSREIMDTGTTPANILQDAISELSGRLSRNAKDPRLLRSVEALIAAHEKLRFTTVPQAVLAASLVRAALPATDAGSANLALRVRKLEEAVAAGKGTAPAPKAAGFQQKAPAAPKVRPASPPVAAAGELERFRQALVAQNPAYGPLGGAILSLERNGGNVIARVAAKDAALVDMLASASAAQEVGAVLEGIYGRPAPTLRIEHGDGGPLDSEKQKVVDLLTSEFGEENVEIRD